MEDIKREKKAEMMVELGGLNEDVMLEVFDRIPIKQLTQMKCLSKGWCSLISHYRRSRPRSSTANFICQYNFSIDEGSQVMFYDIKEQVDNKTGEKVVETLENHSLSFSIDSSFQLIGSSNGLILGFYKISDKTAADDKDTSLVPYVCNPILNQWNPLPPFSKGKRSILMGLAFDGVPQNHFKVVICYVHYVKRYGLHISRHIYSSDIGIWRKKRVKFFNSCVLPDHMSFDSQRSNLYRKGMVHWVCCGFMLVYHFEKDFFKIVKLPSTDGCVREPGSYLHYCDRCVWESEGYLHYCDNNNREFSIWKLVDDEVFETQFDDENAMAKWQQLKLTVEFRSLIPQFLKIVGPRFLEYWRKPFIQLLGFEEDLHILYLTVQSMCFSYSFETRRLKKLSTCNPRENTASWVCASFFLQPSGVNLHLGDDCKLLIPKRECQGGLWNARIILL